MQRSWFDWSNAGDYLLSKTLIIDPRGCWEWQGAKTQQGYGQASWRNKKILAHRLAFIEWNGEIKQDSKRNCVCHKCDNPCCINPAHLFLGTHRANLKDAIKKRRHLGRVPDHAVKKNRHRKLSDVEVIAIRSSTETLKDLASRFNCSTSNISLIRNGRRKKLVDGPQSEMPNARANWAKYKAMRS